MHFGTINDCDDKLVKPNPFISLNMLKSDVTLKYKTKEVNAFINTGILDNVMSFLQLQKINVCYKLQKSISRSNAYNVNSTDILGSATLDLEWKHTIFFNYIYNNVDRITIQHHWLRLNEN